MSKGPMKLEDKDQIFRNSIGKMVRVYAGPGCFYGVLADVSPDRLRLKPRLMYDPTSGHLAETGIPLEFRAGEISVVEPVTAEMYGKLQEPHPWTEFVGCYVLAPTNSGREFAGVLRRVTSERLILSPYYLGHPFNSEMEGPLVLEASDVTTLHLLTEELYRRHFTNREDSQSDLPS
ncbi:hypothetical protein HYX10_02915 [Candidatus Woesearchaeota archaeon]|nr:hypothetical protein [Candidatus Woesearchaeota archaeon]